MPSPPSWPRPTKNRTGPLAISIVDDTGSIITYARMDRCREVPKRMATRKAYTCALSGQDSKDYADRMASQNRTVAEDG